MTLILKRRRLSRANLLAAGILSFSLLLTTAAVVDDTPKRLPGIPTNASHYSDFAPYLCYPGSD